MFGAIKKMFKRGGSGSEESSATTQAVAEENAPTYESSGDQSPRYSAPARGGSGESLRISLRALVANLPKELQGKNSPGGNEALILPKQQVLEQLAQGTVKVPFGQVRRLASTGVLAGGSSHDNRMVDVPLKEILAQLRAEEFSRRQDQRVIKVPEEIQDLFGARGQHRATMRVMQKEELKPATRSEQAPEGTSMPVYQTPTAETFGTPMLQQQARIPISSAPRQAPAAPSPLQPIQRSEFLSFDVAELSQNWPDAIRRELQRLGAQRSKFVFPTAEIQEALKQGRVSYSWRQVSGRLQPALPPHTQLTNDQTALDLPIAVVASAFFTQTQAANRQAAKAPASTSGEPVFRGGPAAPAQPAPIPIRTAAPPPPPAPIQAPPQLRLQQESQAPAPAARPAGPSKGNVSFKVSDVWSNWPDDLKSEANKLRINSAKVEIPFEIVEPGLRSGRIEFSWGEFCGWVQNCPAQAQSSGLSASRVALPLSVLAPLCLRLSPPTARKAATLDDIPDIFGPGGQTLAPEEAEDAPVFQKGPAPAAARPAAPVPAPPPIPPPPRAPMPPPQPAYTPAPALAATVVAGIGGPTAKNLAELFGEPGKRNWTPNEIVQHTAHLPGVSGALIALQDGLLVANCMPQGWRTETIAAFLPQIFGRMSQYVKELGMGDLVSVNVAVEQGMLQVYKAGIIYFAALARPEGALPLAPLNLIARELSRHTK